MILPKPNPLFAFGTKHCLKAPVFKHCLTS